MLYALMLSTALIMLLKIGYYTPITLYIMLASNFIHEHMVA